MLISLTRHLFLFCFTTLLIHNSLSLSLLFHKSYLQYIQLFPWTAIMDYHSDHFF